MSYLTVVHATSHYAFYHYILTFQLITPVGHLILDAAMVAVYQKNIDVTMIMIVKTIQMN